MQQAVLPLCSAFRGRMVRRCQCSLTRDAVLRRPVVPGRERSVAARRTRRRRSSLRTPTRSRRQPIIRALSLDAPPIRSEESLSHLGLDRYRDVTDGQTGGQTHLRPTVWRRCCCCCCCYVRLSSRCRRSRTRRDRHFLRPSRQHRGVTVVDEQYW